MDLGDHQEGALTASSSCRRGGRDNAAIHRSKFESWRSRSFQKCGYPDEAQSAQLACELGLETQQITSWFQNHRTQMKVEYERAEKLFLREENTRILSENMVMREVLKNFICLNPNCMARHYIDQQEELSKENTRLMAESLRCATSFQDEI